MPGYESNAKNFVGSLSKCLKVKKSIYIKNLNKSLKPHLTMQYEDLHMYNVSNHRSYLHEKYVLSSQIQSHTDLSENSQFLSILNYDIFICQTIIFSKLRTN